MNGGKICVSVCAATADQVITKIKWAAEFADIIEVRFDCLDAHEIEALKSQISNLKFDRPLIATFRSSEQGGRNAATLDERRAFWASCPDSFWAVDVEEDVFPEAARCGRRIASFHDLLGVPDDLQSVNRTLIASGAEMIKIAVTASDAVDGIAVWKLLQTSRELITIAMGEAGKWTRILSLGHGSPMTYASLETGEETASGQISAREMAEVYRVRDLDQDTKVYGVVGDPVVESLSPYIHNRAFFASGFNAVFIPFWVKDLDAFMNRMVHAKTREVELNFAGFSVTMPHKQAIMKYLDGIDPTAEAIGAVNTVKIDDGKLFGYNTDAQGFIAPLKKIFGDLRDARVVVFGAGGAARACVYALKQENAKVTVVARDEAKARMLAEQFEVGWTTISNFKSAISNSLADIIVNATPLGMKGTYENESPFTADELEGVKLVYDLVTNRMDTPLIREAKKAGIPTIGGLEMLIEQGVKQLEIWTGQPARAENMREAAVAQLGQTT